MKIKRSFLVLPLLCLLSCTIYPWTISTIHEQINSMGNRLFNSRILPVAIASAISLSLLYKYCKKAYRDQYGGYEGDALVRACRAGDLQTVQVMLRNTDINTARFESYNFANCPAIHFACVYGNVDILRWMVEEKGADINAAYEYDRVTQRCIDNIFANRAIISTDKRKANPLFACEIRERRVTARHRAEKIAYLIERGVNLDTALHIACGHWNGVIVPILHDLVNRGANLESVDENGDMPLHLAMKCKYLLNENILLQAAHVRRINIVNARNAQGLTPLHVLMQTSHNDQNVNALRTLLQYGADINAVDTNGNTPLFYATSMRRNRLIWGLVPEADMDWFERTFGTTRQTPREVIEYGSLQLVRALVENGATINVTNNDGETPLMKACTANVDIVRYLLEQGADISAETNDGRNALYFACVAGKQDIVALLIARGVEVKNEYEFGGILRQGDRGLDFDVEKLLNEKIAKKKELEEAARKFIEGEQEREAAKQKVKDLLFDTDVPACAKKELLPQLFELRKNNEDLFSDIDFEKCVGKITFDKKFLQEEKFKELVEFVKAKKIKDLNGKVIT